MELSNADLKERAPSIFAKKPWAGVSERYGFIPTIKVIDALRDEGFVPVTAQQSMTRVAGKKPFAKHMLRFRMKEETILPPKVVNGNAHHFYKKGEQPYFVEAVLTNAHDLSGVYSVNHGIFRQLCSNGLMVSCGTFGGFSIRHSGDIVDEVLRATKAIIADTGKIRKMITDWERITLSEKAALTMAKAVLINRYGMDEEGAILGPIAASQLLGARRPEDEGDNLWLMTNRIQENIMRGELVGAAKSGRKVTTRAIKGVNSTIALNQSIWAVAEVMAEAA